MLPNPQNPNTQNGNGNNTDAGNRNVNGNNAEGPPTTPLAGLFRMMAAMSNNRIPNNPPAVQGNMLEGLPFMNNSPNNLATNPSNNLPNNLANNLAFNPAHVNVLTPQEARNAVRMIRSTADPQPTPYNGNGNVPGIADNNDEVTIENDETETDHTPAVDTETEIPERFEEVQGRRREILIPVPESGIDETKTAETTNTETNSATGTETGGIRVVSTLPHANLSRRSIGIDAIKGLASHIHKLIITKRTKHPDFTNLTKTGYRKIKNYIHNVTSVWLSQEEIDLFVAELDAIDGSH